MQAILFDLDGTLIDSIPLWIEANVDTLADFDVVMDPETFLTEFYHPGMHYEGILEKAGADPIHNSEYYAKRNDRFALFMRTHIEYLDGAEQALMACKEIAPLGLMTGSTDHFIAEAEARLHLAEIFEAIVTHTQTGVRMKPDPFGLELLSANLHVDPKQCIYVGDQHVDVLAAHELGMPCVLIPRGETPEEAKEEADYVLGGIGELVEVLKTTE